MPTASRCRAPASISPISCWACRNRARCASAADNNYFRGWATNGYVQDDWRITRGLSFNLGLRYEYFAPYTELFGHLANLDLSSGHYRGVGGDARADRRRTPATLPTSLVRSDPNNFSPRFGFAWRPSARSSAGHSAAATASSIAARLRADRRPDGVAAAVRHDRLAHHQRRRSADARRTASPSLPSQTITNTYAIDPNYKLGLRADLDLRGAEHAAARPASWNSNTSAPRARTWASPSSPIAPPPGSPLTAQQRLQIANATGFNLPDRRAAIPSSTPARCGSPAASRAACRPSRSTRFRSPSTTPPASAAPAAPPCSSSTTWHWSAGFPPSTSGIASQTTYPALLAGRRARHAAQRRMEDHGAHRLDAERQLHRHLRARRSPHASPAISPTPAASRPSARGRAEATGLPIDAGGYRLLQPRWPSPLPLAGPVRKCRPRHHSRASSRCRSTASLNRVLPVRRHRAASCSCG